jgi:hypothetical protein
MSDEPKLLTDSFWPDYARKVRDRQWRLMDLAAEFGTAWFCVWNKARKPELADEMRHGLIDGMEVMGWFTRDHPDWFIVGKWDDARYALPIQLTEAGRAAMADRSKYDDEPVFGGLVDPGWKAFPAPKEEAGHAAAP